MAEKSGKQRAKAAPAEAFRRPDAPDPAAASASFAGERERELSTLFDTLPGMVYRCANDRQWTMEFVSETCRELTGYARDDLVANRTISYGDLIHTDDRERVWNSIEAALDARVPWTIEYRIIRADGSERWVRERGVGVRDESGTLRGFGSPVGHINLGSR